MKYAVIASILALSGCMTIEKLPTASTYDVFDAACLSKTASNELRQKALIELGARGLTCQEAAKQALQIRMANPQVFGAQPAQLRPYVMPTQQTPYQSPPSTSVHATLIGQTRTTSASGQAAYLCQYRTSTGTANVVQIATDGHCPPTANLR